ncbi:MAG: hypothetical protein P1P69_01030 [Methanosarcinaceae archaeon]|nr:hypothetical protein [Methanosarcinaceae archaeon]
MVSIAKHAKEMFFGGTIVTILFFLVIGFMYPATNVDFSNGNTIPFYTDGQNIMGQWTHWFANLFFTFAVLLLGKALYSTFLKMDMTEWNWFAFGSFLLFMYGLSSVASGLFDYNLFMIVGDLLLPIGLLLISYSIYKIYEPFEEA